MVSAVVNQRQRKSVSITWTLNCGLVLIFHMQTPLRSLPLPSSRGFRALLASEDVWPTVVSVNVTNALNATNALLWRKDKFERNMSSSKLPKKSSDKGRATLSEKCYLYFSCSYSELPDKIPRIEPWIVKLPLVAEYDDFQEKIIKKKSFGETWAMACHLTSMKPPRPKTSEHF